MKKEKKILLITDDRGYLFSSLLSKGRNHSIELEVFVKYLKEYGWDVEWCKYSDFNDSKEFKNGYVLYASSEDYGLFYKDFIEDVLLALKKNNNTLLPEFDFFRAHHNKVYMELLRKQFKDERIKKIKTWIFSSYFELQVFIKCHEIAYPVVVKAASGAGSSGVGIAHTGKELLKLGKKYSNRVYFDHYANVYRTVLFQKGRNFVRKLKGKEEVFYRKKQGKFIVQNFIRNLDGDYKVLVFGEKYYVLQRKNRENDFRASGSGHFSFPGLISEVECVLNYARSVKEEIKQPLLSLDIAYDGSECYLIEFQCLNFGPYTLQMSDKYFMKNEKGWEAIEKRSLLEEEIARALNFYYEKCI